MESTGAIEETQESLTRVCRHCFTLCEDAGSYCPSCHQPYAAKAAAHWIGWDVVASLLVPIVGIVLGLRFLIRERIGPGLALILIALLCGSGYFGAYLAIEAHRVASDKEQAVERVANAQIEEDEKTYCTEHSFAGEHTVDGRTFNGCGE